MLNNINAFFVGKRTYLIGFVVFILGGLQALGYHIPSDVYALLGGAGAMSLRAAIK